jgi:ring-1,2-phenylacetyl-CoA epoxidase subunit PaaC
MQRLTAHADPVLRAVATKAVAELSYHRDYAAGWVVRLGDGTHESHKRMQCATDALVPLAAELRDAEPGTAAAFDALVSDVFAEATLVLPSPAPVELRGRSGQHTPALAALLDELQVVARTHPEASW